VAIPSIEIHDVGLVENSNKLLGDNGIDGIKTGTLNDFGANLLFSVDLAVGASTVPLVGIVLGAATHEQLNGAVRDLVGQVQAGYREVPVIAVGDVIGDYTTSWETSSAAVAAEDASLVVWADTPITATAAVDPVRLADEGSPAGSIRFAAGSRTVDVPLVLSAAVQDPGPWWRLSHPEIIFGLG